MTVAYRGLARQGGVETSTDLQGQRSYTFKHTFETTTAPNLTGTYAALLTALASEGVILGALCPLDIGTVCSRIAPNAGPQRSPQGGTPYWEWEVGVTFSSQTGKQDPNNSQKDPLLRPPVVTFSTETHPVAAKSIDGYAPYNSAWTVIPREMRRARTIINIQKNFAAFDWNALSQCNPDAPTQPGYLFSRNADAWDPQGPYTSQFGTATILEGQALLQKMNAAYVYENGSVHVAVSAEIAFDPREHADEFVDEGYFTWTTHPTGKPTRIIGSAGEGVGPFLLDGSGDRATGSPPTPSYRSFQYYPLKDWSGLGLP